MARVVATLVQPEPSSTPSPDVAPQATKVATLPPSPEPTSEVAASPEPPTVEPTRPTIASPAAPCKDDSEFVKDVTIPDNTKVAPGEAFVKTWRLRNSGTCTWTAGYHLVYQSGQQMGAAESVDLERDVPPNDEVDISVSFTAPAKRGKHRSQWRLRAPDGTVFGTKPFVQIKVTGEPKATQPPTVEPSAPTSTPQPTETPEVVTGLEEELVFALGSGGPGEPGQICLQPPADLVTPAIAGHGRLVGVTRGGAIHTEDDGVVCLYGVPSDGELAVDLFVPSGELAGSAVFRVEGDNQGNRRTLQVYPELAGPPFDVEPALADLPIVGSAQTLDGLEILSIAIWLPAGLPSGEWRMAARWKDGRVEAPFTVGGPAQPIVNPMPNAPIDPFQEFRAANHTYVRYEEFLIQGAGFQANNRFPVGLYHLQGESQSGEQRGLLVRGVMVETDGQGSFSTVMQAGGLYPGTYMIVSNPVGGDHGQGLSFFTIAD
jgi:hypothetical protein